MSLVARTGDAAAGTAAGVTYAGLDGATIVLNNAGQTAFEVRLTGTGVVGFVNDRGIWSQGSGSLLINARGGDQAAGLASGVVYGSYLFSPVINGSGQTAFYGGLAGAGVNATNDSAIWAGGTGSLALVVREGDAAPGTGVVFASNFGLGLPVINDAGQIAFKGWLEGTGVNTTNDTGIWSEGSGSLSLIAREGSNASGTAAGVVYSYISNPLINGASQIAFTASLTGTGVDATNNSGLWLESSGVTSLIARTGDQAPGAAAGKLFSSGFGAMFNGLGQLAFTSKVTGSGAFADEGLWATDTNGVIILIALEGDLFDVNDDPMVEDLRTISLIRFGGGSGGEDGRPTGFNDADQLVFRLRFTDNSEGILVATIPEPATLTLLALGSAAIVRRRRRL